MAERDELPIPADLAEAFLCSAKSFWSDWMPSNPSQPLINIDGKLHSISAICDLKRLPADLNRWDSQKDVNEPLF
jgi:hypothetical protein